MDLRSSGGGRIAFFGGSFDPPHLGHLAVARAAREALGLDTVLFAPVGAQPLKPQASSASFAHRVAMVRLAIAGQPGFALSLADAPRPSGKPNYTLETLLQLRVKLPPEGILFCLMGADSFAGIRSWHRAAEIPFAAPLIVASRPGELPGSLEDALPDGLSIESLPEQGTVAAEVVLRSCQLRNSAGDRAPFYLLPSLQIEISASAIRSRIREKNEGLPPGGALLPASVSDYIRAHGLYR